MTIPITVLDFCSEPVDLFCPICGEQIFTRGQQKNICRHTLFTADSAAGTWSWHQNHYTQPFQAALEKKYADACKNGFYEGLEAYTAALRPDTAAIVAAEIISSKSVFMLSISTSDIGCGGMHNGIIHAIFDYLPKAERFIQTIR